MNFFGYVVVYNITALSLNYDGESFYYWMECIYIVENTLKTSYWPRDGLAGIAMVLKDVFGRG